mgnify:CR=1 FL=1
MAASTYAANKLLDLLLRGVAFVPPTRVYVSLHTADPGNAGGNEITLTAWPAYVRKDPANGGAIGTGFSVAANKASNNLQEMLWGAQDGAAPITATHFAIWDALTNGNLLVYGPLTVSKIVGPTDELVIHSPELKITVQ